ncbi:YhcN/YlaJ family sporulation lipoprotein [Solibacillus cecembensis]|uniref:YhcN/YlaJ family sporulation lipoprotein n=1 Tax=Solibacillus cecembensis TaxID=459347 RepID=UPI003D08315C
MRKWFVVACFALLLVGCGEREKVFVYQSGNEEQNKQEIQHLLKEADVVDEANVIFLNDELFVAIQVKPWKKWNRMKVEESWQKKLEQKFTNLNVTVSTDFKMFWETTKIIDEQGQQDVQEKIHDLKKLAKEET